MATIPDLSLPWEYSNNWEKSSKRLSELGMISDLFSLGPKFERETNLRLEKYSGFQKVWKPTKTYKGEGIMDPYDLAPFATAMVEELNILNPEDAIIAFYSFVDGSTGSIPHWQKNTGKLKGGLSPLDYMDSYGTRTLISGKGLCTHIAAEILGLCRGVGIPSRFEKPKEHGYVAAWTPDSGWVHIGHSEGILANPKTPMFQKYMDAYFRELEINLGKADAWYLEIGITAMERKSLRKRIIAENIGEFMGNMKKYGYMEEDMKQEFERWAFSAMEENSRSK